MRLSKYIGTGMLVTAVLLSSMLIAQPAAAQGPGNQPPQPDSGVAGLAAFSACVNTDMTGTAAKALGVTEGELRAALVGGKSVQQIATEKNVQMKTVTDAIQAARTALYDQAVKDGLLTQQQADLLKRGASGAASAAGSNFAERMRQRMRQMFPNLPSVPALPGQPNRPNQPNPAPAVPRVTVSASVVTGVTRRNPVKPIVVAAQALNMSCADLVKALQSNKSIARVTTEKNVQLQTVIDALVKAYQAALSKDLEQGLVAKAVADSEQTKIADRVLSLMSRQGLGSTGAGMIRFNFGVTAPRGNSTNPSTDTQPATPAPAVPRG